MATRTILFIVLFLLQEKANCLKCYSKYSPYFRGYYMEARDCPGATLRNSTLTDPNTVCCILDSTIVPNIPQNINVSLESYLKMVGDTTRTRALYPFYMQALSEAGITSRQEIAAFTAQILYQTTGMNVSEESSNGQEYIGKENLGNTKKTDARKYISRGFLPLVGKHMYRLAKSSVNSKIIRQPERVALPSVGFKVAAWLWTNGYSSADNSSSPTGNLGNFCNGTEYGFAQLSVNIQQGAAGIEKLFQYWRHTLEVLGLPCPSEGKGPSCLVGKRKGRCKLVTSCKGEYSAAGCPGSLPITCCLDCQNPIDLVFVLDSSMSVKAKNFQLGLQFVIRVCEYFNIGYPHGTRVALIIYHHVSKIVFSFNTYVKKQDVLNAIGAIPYEAGGGTRTDLALLEAHTNLFDNPDNGVRPIELGVPRVLVLLTDGRAGKGTASVIEPSKVLRREGVSIFVIGIGPRINTNELNVIASDPDADHVVSSQSFSEVNAMVENIREASCYEPAVLEEEREVMSSVKQNSINYYKYDLMNKTGIKTVFLQTTRGMTEISASTNDRNPRNSLFNLGSCAPRESNNHVDTDRLWQLDELESSAFCNVTTTGGCTKPRFVSYDEFAEKGFIIYVKTCSSRWFYVSVEGVNKTNTFNLTLFKDFIRTNVTIEEENNPKNSKKNDTTFPIPKKVYAGAAVATIGTTATVAAVVTLSCAKEFQIKGSTKIKKRKKKEEAKNNNSADNKAFEGDDDKNQRGIQNRSSLTPLLEDSEMESTCGTSTNDTGAKTELLKKERTRTIYVTEKRTHDRTGTKKCKSGNDTEQGNCHVAEINEDRQRKFSRHSSLVSSMIYDLQREDTFIEQTVTSETPRNEGSISGVKGPQFKRQVTSTSVSVSVVTSKAIQKGKVSSGEKHDGDSTQHAKGLQAIDSESEKQTICCFQWQPSLSNNKVRRRLQRLKTNWNKLTLKRTKLKDRRFERDMQMSQAFCVLASQLLFLAGADARDDTIACAVVAIAMNYLSLVTLCWLIVQALYLFSFTRKRESEVKRKMIMKLYYGGAWGLPLFAVLILVSKYESYKEHPHCWISFTDTLSWSVATPIITLGMVQLILVVLLVKALISYRKSGDTAENENKKSVIKSGLQTVVCITITVILTWLLGSLSLNIDLDIYHTFFTIFNALQGFAFFLFYVLLNPEVRKLILAAWEWKSSLQTPFDEHQAIEIEEEKEKDKKKGKGKSKITNNNTKDKKESKEENQKDQAIANTVQTVTEAKMAASSIAANSNTKNTKNVTAINDVKKETRKPSLTGIKSDANPRKLPPIEQQTKANPPYKGAVPRRTITPPRTPTGCGHSCETMGELPPNPHQWKFLEPIQEDSTAKRKAAGASPSPKDKSLRSPSSTAQQSRTPAWNKKKVQFEFKDNLPVAAFSSPPPNVRPRSPQRTVVPNTTPKKNQKPVGKKKTTKGKKPTKP
ncbi:hypothetical protein ACROYT_G007000 [Oculina patagonica]